MQPCCEQCWVIAEKPGGCCCSGWTQFRDFGYLQAINNLAGTISWIFGLALWVTSVDWFRRRYHQSFHTVHMLGFLGFTLFALLHYPGMWVGCLPGEGVLPEQSFRPGLEP